MTDAELAALRQTYAQRTLLEADVLPDAVRQFRQWLDEAVAAQLPEPAALTLATVDVATGQLVAALNFFWPGLERQVRVEGRVEKAPENVSTEYFQSRPRSSQVGAWASPQSQIIANREELEGREHEIETRFEGQNPLPRPAYWGGYVLHPTRVEFWQGRPSRLHDRLVYEREGDSWKISRLAP